MFMAVLSHWWMIVPFVQISNTDFAMDFGGKVLNLGYFSQISTRLAPLFSSEFC